MTWRQICCMLLLMLLPGIKSTVDAQFFSGGQSPGSLRWSQINTDNFQVIFPAEYEEHGRYIADVLEYAYEYATISLEHRPRKVSVIVHNHTVVSNGFVAWAPRRMELFVNPPADNEQHNWMEYLIVHELRHVIQIDKLNQGLVRLLGVLFGEQATGAVLGMFVPLWFLEGDAIVAETALTHAGRGRIPSFEQSLRAQTLTRGIWSFDKAVFGSYKDHVPNHYELGYQLVAAARIKEGGNVWADVIRNVSRRPWSLVPFSAGMKKNIGATKDSHYSNTFSFLDSVWTVQRNSHAYTHGTVISPKGQIYTNYSQPHWLNDTTVIALKTGMGDIPRIVKVCHNGTETELLTPGWHFPNAFHFAAGRLVWNELRPDPRWQHRNWSEIMIWDFATGDRRRITNKGRYFAPALSPDGTQIAAIETTPLSRYYLVVIDSESGQVVFRHAYLDNDFMQTPAWHPDGIRIAIVATDERGKRIDVINTDNGKIDHVMLPDYYLFSNPKFWGDDLLITGSWSGIDNIYRFNSRTGEISKVVSSEFGAVGATINSSGTHILYSDYSVDGYRLKIAHINDLMDLPLSEVKNHSPAFHKELKSQENTIVTRPNIPRHNHEVKPYSRLKNLFHLHSWAPAYIDARNQSVNSGVSMLFHNKLSTSFATLGYLWDSNDQTGKFRFEYSYQGWYPVFNFVGETGQRRFHYHTLGGKQNFLFRENFYGVNMSVPLRFRHHEYFYGLTPSFGIGFTHASPGPNTPDTVFVDWSQFFLFREEKVLRHDYGLRAFRQVRSVERDIFPRWGQQINIAYRHTPFSPNRVKGIFAITGVGYFPGVLRHHGLRLSAAYQRRDDTPPSDLSLFYSFANIITYPRGYTAFNHRSITAYSADYVFPLLYPDLSIRHLLYLMRVGGHFFVDHAVATPFPNLFALNGSVNERFTSFGFGITGDMHLFRFMAPISLGAEVIFAQGRYHETRMIFGTRF